MQVEVKLVNQILKDYFLGKLNLVTSSKDDNWGEEKSQGSYGYCTNIYATSVSNLFLKVVEKDDSYGEECGADSIEFVQPVIKNVTDYISI